LRIAHGVLLTYPNDHKDPVDTSFVAYICSTPFLQSTLACRYREQDRKGKRLWLALIIHELVEERPIKSIIKIFSPDVSEDAPNRQQLSSTELEDLQSSGAMFSGKVAQFALNVGYEDIAVLCQNLISRIANGAKADILPLCEIPQIQVIFLSRTLPVFLSCCLRLVVLAVKGARNLCCNRRLCVHGNSTAMAIRPLMTSPVMCEGASCMCVRACVRACLRACARKHTKGCVLGSEHCMHSRMGYEHCMHPRVL
jgi:hypothetical protein